MYDAESLKNHLADILNDKDTVLSISIKRGYCIVSEENTNLEYLAVFPNNRPANMEIVDYFDLKTENGENGRVNNNVRSFKKPAVIAKTDNNTDILIERGELEVW